MFIYFLGVNLMFLTTHLAPNIMIGTTRASGVLLNLNILRENIALTPSLSYVMEISVSIRQYTYPYMTEISVGMYQ